jgi:DNA-binding transcriptional LysR family regulator
MLDDLEAFVRVVEAGSYTAAAAQVGVPKSTLSRAITRLEAQTKMRLLRRSTRVVALTEEGRTLYDSAGPHLSGLVDALERVKSRADEPTGTLRITTVADIGETVLAELLPRFLQRFPKLSVEVDQSVRVVNLVEEGYDVALRAARKLDDNLVAKRLGESVIRLFAAPTYLSRHGWPKSEAELLAHERVVPPFMGGPGRARSRRVGATFELFEGARTRCMDFTLLRHLLREGAGIGPLPEFLAARDVEEGRLEHVLPSWSFGGGPRAGGATLWLVYPKTPHLAPKVRAFRDFVLEALRSRRGVSGAAFLPSLAQLSDGGRAR